MKKKDYQALQVKFLVLFHEMKMMDLEKECLPLLKKVRKKKESGLFEKIEILENALLAF